MEEFEGTFKAVIYGSYKVRLQLKEANKNSFKAFERG
jgi:hypothetical protein